MPSFYFCLHLILECVPGQEYNSQLDECHDCPQGKIGLLNWGTLFYDLSYVFSLKFDYLHNIYIWEKKLYGNG